MPNTCPRCQGWVYADDPRKMPPYTKEWKTNVWCLMCGEHIHPPEFQPLPYVIFNDERIGDDQWFIDEHGDIIDIIDQKIEEFIERKPYGTYNVSYVAKAVHCSNSEARMTLDRLVRIGELDIFQYGPQSRWTAYRRVPSNA